MPRCNPRTCPRPIDMRAIVRTPIVRRIVREFREGQSVRVLVRRYGLNPDGVQALIRAEMR